MMSHVAAEETRTPEVALPRVRLVRSWRLEGAIDFAKALGVSPATVYYVLSGKRRSPRIEAALAAQGIKCRQR